MWWMYFVGVSLVWACVIWDIHYLRPPIHDDDKSDRLWAGFGCAVFCPILIWFVVPAIVIKTILKVKKNEVSVPNDKTHQ